MRVSLAGLDTIAANIKAWSGALRGDGTCVLSDGTVRYFKVHENIKDCDLVGKCVDLAHAYRQVAARRSHSSCAVIGVRSAEDDFVNLEADVFSANADAANARLMKIIGYRRSKEETRSFSSR